jgi:hypothetical protein
MGARMKPRAGRGAEAPPEHSCGITARGLADLALVLVALGYTAVAAVGLPLFGDGAYYFVEILLEDEALIPNYRYAAMLPQLPVVLALGMTDDPVVLRRVFSAGYALVPLLTLLGCWLIVRRRVPGLLLLPLLSFLALQINFSGVSELMLSLALSWPALLLLLLRPNWVWTWAYGLLLAPTLALLHPLAFAPALLLAGAAVVGTWRERPLPVMTRVVATLLTVSALVRLGWTAVGLNAYERAHTQGDSAVAYLVPPTDLLALLLALVLLVGVLVGWWLLRPGRGLESVIGGLLAVLSVLAAAVGLGFVQGVGIELKAALTFPLGLLLMTVSAAVVWFGPAQVPLRSVARGALLVAGLILLLALSRSVAWWTATHGLADLLASSETHCIPFGPRQPFSLQWPWMAIIDDWTTPIQALAFRDPNWPAPLMLPDDGCQRLADDGVARLTSWFAQPIDRLDANFGPLRR